MNDNTVSKLPDWQKGWLAGILDGEGYFGIQESGGRIPPPRAGVSMSCELTIKTIHTLLEPIGSNLRIYEHKGGTLPTWTCELNSRMGVYELLTALLPYFLTKAEKANMLLTYVKRRIANIELSIEDTDIITRLHELNLKGSSSKRVAIKGGEIKHY